MPRIMLQEPTNAQTTVAESYPRPFGDFELLKALSSDERGEVFVALRPEGVDRLCVVSVLAPNLARREELVDGLRAEAAWLVRRVHGNVVQIYDVGQADDAVFFVSELVEGRNLGALLAAARERARSVEPEFALQVAIDVGDAFEFIRGAEERSTGIKTTFLGNSASSIIVGSDGRAKLLHQGSCLAPRLAELGPADVGRVSLLAPERARGEPPSVRSDVFAVGSLLWQTLTGRPLAGGSVAAHLEALRSGKFVPVSPLSSAGDPSLVTVMPEGLEAALMAALDPKPENRPADIAAFRSELVAALKKTGAQEHEAGRGLVTWLFGQELANEAAEITQLVAQAESVRPGSEVPRRPSVTLTNFESKRRRTPLPQPADLVLGETISGTRYRALSKLGEGGMGAVYMAEHVDIEKKVALKLLHAELLANPVVLQQFRQEARAASKIGNPYICDVTDWGEVADGRVFFVMEYLDGISLSKAIKTSRRMSPARVIPVLRQCAKALGAAHEKGIVHLDIKPDNVLLLERDGRGDAVKVVDFGIAGLLGQGGAGAKVMGTPEYMAPERTTGTGYDHRSDIYSLGVMAYEMLVGEVPFQGQTAAETLAMQALDAPDAINERLTKPVPEGLEALILQMLDKSPDRRPQTMAEVEALLCEAQADARIRTPWDDHLALPPVDRERARRIHARLRGVVRKRMILVGAGLAAAIAWTVILVTITKTPATEPTPAMRDIATRPNVEALPQPTVSEEPKPAAPAVVATTPSPTAAQPPGPGAAAARPNVATATTTAPRRRRDDAEPDDKPAASGRDAAKAREAAQRGVEALNRELVQLAEKEFEAALRADSSNVEATGGLAAVRFEQADYREAKRLATSATRGRRPNPRHLIVLGDACFKLNQFDDALAAYERAKELAPNDGSARAGIDRVKKRLGK